MTLIASGREDRGRQADAASRYDKYLKLLMVTLFLPEGFSFFIGDFRLSLVRVMLIALSVCAAMRFAEQRRSGEFVVVPSDVMALATGAWMILSVTVTGDVSIGLKGGSAAALEFTGAYFVVRRLLGPVDSSVRLTGFMAKLLVIVVGVAFLDTLTGTLFTYEFVKRLTGYAKPGLDELIAVHAESVFRNGSIRAQGPLEHSILFGAVCAWFSTLTLATSRARFFGCGIAAIALIGILISQARAPLVAYAVGVALIVFNSAAQRFAARWRVLGSLVALYIAAVFSYSGSPIATLLRFAGVDPSAAWYRELIWKTAGPMVMSSPLFGVGLYGEMDLHNTDLVGGSVDSLWLATAMMFGLPGSLLLFLTMVGAFWLGPVDQSPYLSPRERRLSVALGFVTSLTIFLGFTVHLYGACAILLGIFPGIRANLAEAAIVRSRAAQRETLRSGGSIAAAAVSPDALVE